MESDAGKVWRERAARLREAAEQGHNGSMRRILLDLADEYDRMSAELDEVARRDGRGP
jgi:hypothetical protein